MPGGDAVEILNSKVTEAIQAGVGLCLNLGSGERVRPGYFNLDCVRETQPDILADLNAPLSALPDNSVDAVFTRHTLEHVEQLLPLLGELHRVVRADGRRTEGACGRERMGHDARRLAEELG